MDLVAVLAVLASPDSVVPPGAFGGEGGVNCAIRIRMIETTTRSTQNQIFVLRPGYISGCGAFWHMKIFDAGCDVSAVQLYKFFTGNMLLLCSLF